jgi:hypothetical protein
MLGAQGLVKSSSEVGISVATEIRPRKVWQMRMKARKASENEYRRKWPEKNAEQLSRRLRWVY